PTRSTTRATCPSARRTRYSHSNTAPCSHFFFQAEDGIRILTVTGVQTCALPIWAAPHSEQNFAPSPFSVPQTGQVCTVLPGDQRSEERRVGKECRLQRSPHARRQDVAAWSPFRADRRRRPGGGCRSEG